MKSRYHGYWAASRHPWAHQVAQAEREADRLGGVIHSFSVNAEGAARFLIEVQP